MPVELQWHSKLPVLIATYTGTLTSKAYRAMVNKRRKMLAEGPDHVALLVDTRQLENVHDATSFKRDNAHLFDERVAGTFVVMPEDLYRRVKRALDANTQQHYPVQFFGNFDAALAAISTVTKT